MKFVMCLTKAQLVTFVKFDHHETGKVKTAFLEASNLLENSSSADAETITNAIDTQQEDAEIDKKTLSSFFLKSSFSYDREKKWCWYKIAN